VEDVAGLASRFRSLCASREPDLFEGALLVAELVDAGDDADGARGAVAGLAERVREKTGEGTPGVAALCAVLFEEEGFKGDEDSYDEPSNSSVVRVLQRRRGMPITLSIVAIEVGRLAGLRLTGIGLPGHFVVGGPDLPEGMYLDPFDGGALYEGGGLSRRLAAIFGSPVELSPDALRPDSTRAILSRVLLNLRRSWQRRDRWEEALAALEFSEALEPANGSHRRERGLLLLKVGRTEEALEALEAYAATTDGEDLEAVERLIRAARGEAEEESEEAPGQERKIFTLEEARALLPQVRELTSEAVARYTSLPGELEDERESVVQEWMRQVRSLGLEIKGLWLVDFDSGAGYYCWKYPEPAIDHFHGYEEGFGGRLPLQ
jgi:regulator of sirC expression with transglutaminase-like and TPR domain